MSADTRETKIKPLMLQITFSGLRGQTRAKIIVGKKVLETMHANKNQQYRDLNLSSQMTMSTEMIGQCFFWLGQIENPAHFSYPIKAAFHYYLITNSTRGVILNSPSLNGQINVYKF